MFQRHLHYANDTKTFLKHFSDCLFYFCCTCADAWSRNKNKWLLKHRLFYFWSTCADILTETVDHRRLICTFIRQCAYTVQVRCDIFPGMRRNSFPVKTIKNVIISFKIQQPLSEVNHHSFTDHQSMCTGSPLSIPNQIL